MIDVLTGSLSAARVAKVLDSLDDVYADARSEFERCGRAADPSNNLICCSALACAKLPRRTSMCAF